MSVSSWPFTRNPCFSDAVVKRLYASARKWVKRFSPNASESRFPGVLAVLLERSLVPRGMARSRYFSRQLLARRGQFASLLGAEA